MWALHIAQSGFVRQMSLHLTRDPTHDSGQFLNEAPQLAGGRDRFRTCTLLTIAAKFVHTEAI